MDTYVTHGRKYHLDRECPLMNGGENLWEFDSEDGWSHSSGAFRQTVDGPNSASYLGKLPCLHCVPISHRVFPPLYGQTFGHEPVDEYEGTPEGDLGVSHMACKRCKVWTHWKSVGFWIGTRVSWPCTSALVLGLVPRPSKENTMTTNPCENCNGTGADPDYHTDGLPDIPCHVCMDDRAPQES